MTRLFLIANGLGFIFYGLVTFFAPLIMAEALDVVAGGPNGVYEFRGVYGGVSTAAGILYVLGAFNAHYTRPALLFILVYTGGYFAARIAAMPLDGIPQPEMLGFVAYEGIAAALAAFFLGSSKQPAKTH